MKRLLTILTVLSALIITACGEQNKPAPAKAIKITGYPVYKFLSFLGIDSQALKANEEAARELMGDNCDGYVKHHQAMVSAGFDRHELLRVIGQNGNEVEVYVRSEDYKKLWETSPHDLEKQGKSHLVMIEYEPIKVGDQIINRATSFQAELGDHKPTSGNKKSQNKTLHPTAGNAPV